MKRYLTVLCSFVFCVALILTGCATVSDVYDPNGNAIYFETIKYFEGQVAKIGDYIYYANGYADIDASEFNYGAEAKYAGLTRIKSANRFEYKENTEDKNNTSPKGSESVSGKLVGYKNQYMFALGSYLYFTSANTHKTTSAKNDYTRVSIFRVKFNGDKCEELGTFEHDDNSILKAVGDGKNFYYIITVPADDDKTDVYTIKIGDECSGAKKIIDGADSLAICDQDSSVKDIIYTVKSDNFVEEEADCIKSAKLDGTTSDIWPGTYGTTITLNGRVGDNVYYSMSADAVSEVYVNEYTGNSTSFASGKTFWVGDKIKNVAKAGDGVIFIDDTSGSVMYKYNINKDAKMMLTKDDFSDILFVDDEFVYYSNSTSIKRMNVKDLMKSETPEATTIVSMTAIISGQVGYDGEYIYFFAQLENQSEDSADENYYMYRADKEGNYNLMGKTR